MRVATLLGTTLAFAAGMGGLATQVTQAVQLRDGTVYFVQPPSLGQARTTYSSVNAPTATYYFTINVPENAGEPLQRVVFDQRQGTGRVRFDLKDTRAFLGTSFDKGTKIALGEVTRIPNTRTVSVALDPPVPPGRTFTIGLRPIRNPQFSGVYLFGVTAFPPGEKAHGQFLGFGRFTFYGNDRGIFP